MLKQFDIVRINSVKNIKFVSGPSGSPAAPQGDWSVVGFVGSDVLIAKDNTIVRAPLSSLTLVASYDAKSYIKKPFKGQQNG